MPEARSVDSGRAAVAETHLSVVLLTGDRALKLPKPVRLAFVDQSTPARRAEACRRELELNRRLAPDVYLGVLDLVRDGVVVDHLLEMRRMPADRRLATLARDHHPDAADEVARVARRMAAFHAGAERSAPVVRMVNSSRRSGRSPINVASSGTVRSASRSRRPRSGRCWNAEFAAPS